MGTCSLNADQAGNANYHPAAPVTQSFTVIAGNQVITGFGPTSPTAYRQNGTFALTANGGGSGNPVTFASTSPGICTVTGNTATIVTVGSCTLTASQAGNASYNAAPDVTATVTITQATQTINLTYPTSGLAAGGTATLIATGGASPNLVSFATTSPGICTVGTSSAGANGTSTASLSVLAVGECQLSANQAGDTQYLAAPTVAFSLTIGTGTRIYYVHADHLGTPRAITQAGDNAKVWQWKNDDPFGNNPPDENPGNANAQAFKYHLRLPGQYHDQETNTYYNYFRDYNPALGGYNQSDPIGLAGGMNTYGYVSGSPINLTDPTGLTSQARVLALLAQGNLAEATVVANALGLAIAPRLNQMQTSIQGLVNKYPLASNQCEKLASGIAEAFKVGGRVSPQVLRIEPVGLRVNFVRIGETGTYAPTNHVIVRVGDMVYDATTGAQGMAYSQYISILNQINNGPTSYVIKPFSGK